eukprot:gene11301-4112_t
MNKRKYEHNNQEFNKRNGQYYKDSFIQDPWITTDKEPKEPREQKTEKKNYYKESFLQNPWK